MNKYKICIIVIIFILYFITIGKKDEFYENIKTIKNPNTLDVLVNKNNMLPMNYVPNDLEYIDIKYSYENKQLKKEAKEQFEKLSSDALAIGYRIVATSAYRPYDYQKDLYEYYVKEKGQDYADLCSAKPGHSEHQTGLAVDVEGSNRSYDDFEDAIEFNWMRENAHKYGFVLRYPKGKEHITGFKYEPWHYRYVGIETASYIYEKNITLEEYKRDYSS